ncbi:MAG: transcription antitermination factor NusB [Halorhodospira halophila]|uniref:transcription antitermination factor NusB n=1 Tax=Halorhodospira TaxID=85108 RepID=UPI0019144042|nr:MULTISPECIES: transcription antitermination factor NusB [Halorhodospira]MBK5935407.1 N utilization substance protein B [Halorhodospira halophila]MBK5943219.1 N utilization substance protein B [Halorhodospira halophila]MCC3751202.1 transcription antitermination factor NusB [Halorhodospira halophila]MCG5526740.1 transcription antitermination factor NusB [Halorhodospira halophila]MCG5533794.1 transcription antitermination factor NusB [Halorhodospira sp. 9621]
MAASGEGKRRSRARSKLVQALYQYAVTGASAEDIERQFLAAGLGDIDVAYFRELIYAITDRAAELDEQLSALLDRPLAQLDPVERSILRLGAYELSERLEVPYRVVIDESVELARRFGADQSHRYINGVLDRFGATVGLRAAERGERKPGRGNRQ